MGSPLECRDVGPHQLCSLPVACTHLQASERSTRPDMKRGAQLSSPPSRTRLSSSEHATEPLPYCSADELGVSSLHVTFNNEAEAATMTGLGYLQRSGIQYHWCCLNPRPRRRALEYSLNTGLKHSH